MDALWLATEPLDLRAGTETALARGVSVFGAARPHHAYLFATRRAHHMTLLVLGLLWQRLGDGGVITLVRLRSADL